MRQERGHPGRHLVRRSFTDLVEIIREDFTTNAGVGARLALLSYRIGRMSVVAPAGRRAFAAVHRLTRLMFELPQGAELDPRACIGRRLRLPHGGNGIVVSGWSRIEDDVTIYHQVTLGNNSHLKQLFGAPTLASGVTVFVGAKLIGPIFVGACAVVGANAVVVSSVGPMATVAGIPAGPVIRRGE